jgi:hypothetical protein
VRQHNHHQTDGTKQLNQGRSRSLAAPNSQAADQECHGRNERDEYLHGPAIIQCRTLTPVCPNFFKGSSQHVTRSHRIAGMSDDDEWYSPNRKPPVRKVVTIPCEVIWKTMVDHI